MFVLTSYITIGDKSFRRIHSVEISTSVKRIEDTAVVKIPTTARLERAGEYITEIETAKAFAPGDEVVIELGYDGQLREEFRGFVKIVRPNIPIEIECEDEIYLLKRKNLKASFKNTTLKKLLEYIIKDTGISLASDVPVINFDTFYFKNISAAKALQTIKEQYGLQMYFSEWMTLFVGLISDNDDQVIKYEIGRNVIDSSLEFNDEGDVNLKVKAINVKPDNTTIEETVGDPDGELRTLYFYNVESTSELKTRALEELKKYKFTGYRGGFKTFLLPNAQVGNVARIIDPNFPERAGDYKIDEVTTTYGQNGARRKIKPGIKLN